jgi:hypothetical protein
MDLEGVLPPDTSFLCASSSKTSEQYFLHCERHENFGLGFSQYIENHGSDQKNLGSYCWSDLWALAVKLWHVFYYIMHLLWEQCHNFSGKAVYIYIYMVVLVASLWCFTTGDFTGTSLAGIQEDWSTLLL